MVALGHLIGVSGLCEYGELRIGRCARCRFESAMPTLSLSARHLNASRPGSRTMPGHSGRLMSRRWWGTLKLEWVGDDRAFGRVGEIDSGFGRNCIKKGSPDCVLNCAPAPRLDQQPAGQQHTARGGTDVYVRSQLSEVDEVVTRRGSDTLLSFEHVSVDLDWLERRAKYLLGTFPVRLERHEHGNLMPDVKEALGEVRCRVLEQIAVWDVNDATGRLVGVDPVAYFEHREPKRTNVDDVTSYIMDLDSVANLERATEHDEQPASEIEKHIGQSNGETRRQQTQERPEIVEEWEPYPRDDEDEGDGGDVCSGFAGTEYEVRVGQLSAHPTRRDPTDNYHENQRDNRRGQSVGDVGRDAEVHFYPFPHAVIVGA